MNSVKIVARCPACREKYAVLEAKLGQRARCKCGETFLLERDSHAKHSDKTTHDILHHASRPEGFIDRIKADDSEPLGTIEPSETMAPSRTEGLSSRRKSLRRIAVVLVLITAGLLVLLLYARKAGHQKPLLTIDFTWLIRPNTSDGEIVSISWPSGRAGLPSYSIRINNECKDKKKDSLKHLGNELANIVAIRDCVDIDWSNESVFQSTLTLRDGSVVKAIVGGWKMGPELRPLLQFRCVPNARAATLRLVGAHGQPIHTIVFDHTLGPTVELQEPEQ